LLHCNFGAGLHISLRHSAAERCCLKLISVVSPCFNEELNVTELYERVRAVFTAFPHYRYEHIFIDNSSTDATVDILRKLAAADRNVKVIINSRNFGHLRSPVHALYQASGEAVILLLSDLQDPPELLTDMLVEWQKGTPVVLAIKNTSEESGLMFAIRTAYYRTVAQLASIDVFEHFTGFGLYDRKVIDILRSRFNDPYPNFRGMIAEVGLPNKKLMYAQKRRSRGITKNNFYTLYDLAMLSITNLSKVPLRIFTFTGFALAFLSGLVAFVYLAYKLIFWNSFSVGIAPIVIGFFFLMSIQMIGLGVLGEYIGSVHTIVQNRPLVIEKERINFDEPT
jgi:glycosyltransferase involved in cell wall biosynthesis